MPESGKTLDLEVLGEFVRKRKSFGLTVALSVLIAPRIEAAFVGDWFEYQEALSWDGADGLHADDGDRVSDLPQIGLRPGGTPLPYYPMILPAGGGLAGTGLDLASRGLEFGDIEPEDPVISAVPLPGAALLFLSGLVTAGLLRRRRRRYIAVPA